MTCGDTFLAPCVNACHQHCARAAAKEDAAHASTGQTMIPESCYHPSIEQRTLADAFNASLRTILPFNRLHVSAQESSRVWTQLEEVGLFSISLPEDAGGSGLGAAEEALIVMELGRRLAAPSVLSTIAASHSDAFPAQSARIAAAYRSEDGRVVVIADELATQMLVRAPVGATLHAYPQAPSLVDDTLWNASLACADEVPVGIGQVDEARGQRLRLIDAAALAGAAATALEMAVAYAGERKQFGRPVGSFQAVKHHCANMAIAARHAADQVSYAAMAVDQQRDDAGFQVDCALLVAGSSALRNAGLNIQVHGGMGFSDEALPHLLLKYAQLLIALSGGAEQACTRIAMARCVTPFGDNA